MTRPREWQKLYTEALVVFKRGRIPLIQSERLPPADGDTNDLRLSEVQISRELFWSARLRTSPGRSSTNVTFAALRPCRGSFNAGGVPPSRDDERDELCPRMVVAQVRTH